MESNNTPAQPEASVVAKPRRPFKLTGERLGNRGQLAEALLKAGNTITKTAKDLKISRHSVQAIAARMRTPGQATPCGTSPLATNIPAVTPGGQQEFDNFVKGDLQRAAKLTLGTITQSKADQATLRDLAFSADKILGRLEFIEARAGNAHLLGSILQHYGVEQSHSVSRVTVEQRVTVESAGTTPQADKGGDHGIV